MKGEIDFASLLAGSAKCIHCGTPVEHFGVCDRCANRFDAERESQCGTLRSDALQSIPVRYRWATFDADPLVDRCGSKQVLDAQRVCEAISTRRLEGAILWCRRTKVGKTSLATAMMQRLMATDVGLGSRWQCALELASSRGDFGGETWHVEASIRARLLVLDDVGSEDSARRHVVRRVMQARHNDGKPTIVTTPLSPDLIDLNYGEGTGRRFTERAGIVRWEDSP